MSERPKSLPIFHLGSSLLIVVFLVVCLTMFAVLTLTTANANQSRSNRYADRKTAWYEASNEAELILADLTHKLQESEDTAHPEEIRGVKIVWSDAADEDSSTVSGDQTTETASYRTVINDRQSLEVVLSVNGSDVSVTAWHTSDNAMWEAAPSTNLIPLS